MVSASQARERAEHKGMEYLEKKYSTQFEWLERCIEMGKYNCKITISPDDLENLTTMLTRYGYAVKPGLKQFYKCELLIDWSGEV